MKKASPYELRSYYSIGKPVLIEVNDAKSIYFLAGCHTSSLDYVVYHASSSCNKICSYPSKGHFCSCVWLPPTLLDRVSLPESEEELTLLMLGMSYDKTN